MFVNEVCKEVNFRIIRMDLEHEPSIHPNGDYQLKIVMTLIVACAII